MAGGFGIGKCFDDGHLFVFSGLNERIAGEFCHHGGSDGLREVRDFFVFAFDVAPIEDEARQLGIAAIFVVGDCGGDVAGGVDRHVFAGRYDEDVFGVALADGHGKAPADDVAQYVVKDDVGTDGFKGFDGREGLEGGDDAAPGTARAGRGAACFRAPDAVFSARHDVFKFDVGRGLRAQARW